MLSKLSFSSLELMNKSLVIQKLACICLFGIYNKRGSILIIQVYNARKGMQLQAQKKDFIENQSKLGYKFILAYNFISMHSTKPDFFSSANKNKTKLAIRDMTFQNLQKLAVHTLKSTPRKFNLESLKHHPKFSQLNPQQIFYSSSAFNRFQPAQSSSMKITHKNIDLVVPKEEPMFTKRQRISTSIHNTKQLKKSQLTHQNIFSMRKMQSSKKKIEHIFNEIHEEKKKMKKEDKMKRDRKDEDDEDGKECRNEKPGQNFDQNDKDSLKKMKRCSSTYIENSFESPNEEDHKQFMKSPHQVKFDPESNIYNRKKYEVKLNFRKSHSTKQINTKLSSNQIRRPIEDNKIITQFIKTNRLSFQPQVKRSNKVFKVNLVKKKNKNAEAPDQFGRWNWQEESHHWNHEDNHQLILNPTL